jgi:hypothetical protein
MILEQFFDSFLVEIRDAVNLGHLRSEVGNGQRAIDLAALLAQDDAIASALEFNFVIRVRQAIDIRAAHAIAGLELFNLGVGKEDRKLELLRERLRACESEQQ